MVEYYGDHFEINEECCDEFSIVEDNEDSFRMWQGLVGPYYTPYLSQDGTLSFTNNGSLPNPEPVNVRGPQGAGIRIAGIVSSEEYLPASAAEGDIWLVGESAPYEGYSLNAGQWIDLGPLTVGPAGPPGPQGEAGEPGPAGQDGSDGADGVSPEVTVESITGGHTVTITDADHPSGQSFDVMDGQDGDDGVSPEVTVESITGGHTVTITDADHPSGQSFNVMDGQDGDTGPQGPAGPGVPAGGSAGQFYRKASGTDYDGEWHTLSAGDSSYDSSLTYSSGTVGQELSSQRNTLTQLETATQKIIPILSGSTNNLGYTLNVGDYFEAGGVLYKVTTAIPNTEAWGNKASALSTTAINDLKGYVNNVTTGTITKSSVVSDGTLDYVTLKKVGTTVYASARLHSISHKAWDVFFVIQAGFRPSYETYVSGFMDINNIGFVPALARINPDGNVLIGYSASNTAGQVAFAGSWTTL